MKHDIVDSISKIAEFIASTLDRPLNLHAVIDLVSAELSAECAFVLLHHGDTDKLTLAASTGLNVAEFRKLDARSDSEFFRSSFDRAQPVTVNDLNDETLTASDASILDIAPIKIARRTLGLLCVGFPDGSNGQIKVISLIASLIAQNLRVEHAVLGEREKLREENLHLKQELKEKYDFSHLVGTSNAIRQVYDQVAQVAKSNATVLLRGESGTGKEMIANAIHYNSLRSKRPLVKINCAALPDTLIEAELFGHEKGAFTGADRFKKGRFEMAEGGTLFLDEIGDLPLQTQIKLLRVLQEREFERLGGTETIKSNIRLITATNKNLEEAIANGEFREDLYYRLNVFSIYLPPLRERKSDILLLAEHFLEKYEQEHGKRVRRISTPAIDMLMAYHFPGNVRELENAIERAVLVCDSNVIHGHHLPPTLQTAEVSNTVTSVTLASAVQAFERDLIQDTLKSTKGNIAKAAKQLDSTERILGYKIKKYGIDTMRFRR